MERIGERTWNQPRFKSSSGRNFSLRRSSPAQFALKLAVTTLALLALVVSTTLLIGGHLGPAQALAAVALN